MGKITVNKSSEMEIKQKVDDYIDKLLVEATECDIRIGWEFQKMITWDKVALALMVCFTTLVVVTQLAFIIRSLA